MARPALVGVYRPAAPLFVAGSGAWLTDEAGRRYLDFTSGIGVNALGHASPVIRDAISGALECGLVHTSNLFRTSPGEALAEWLTSHSFADAVFFSNSGAEANEAALKFARRWARAADGEGRTGIVALRSGFHGRTYGALSATDRPAYRAPFAPLLPDVHFIDPLDGDAARRAITRSTAAVIVEPLQAEGGVRPLPAGLLARLRQICDEAGALLICDEVQVGLGRTGALWAHEAEGVSPDIMTLAKPLAGGLPMGATLVSARVAAALQPGDHGSTFGGGPLVAAVALAVCRTIADPTFLEGVRRRGARVAARLAAMRARPGPVREVRGAGLLHGLELDRPAAEVTTRALECGLLLCGAGPDVIRVMPPLNIEPGDLELGLDRLEEALA